eukprot:7071013-Pyramimonas_sp.AAC.1
MAALPPFGKPLSRFVAPYGVLPNALEAGSTWRRRPSLAHPSHGPWPHEGFTEGPSRVRMAALPLVGAPLTRFVAP